MTDCFMRSVLDDMYALKLSWKVVSSRKTDKERPQYEVMDNKFEEHFWLV